LACCVAYAFNKLPKLEKILSSFLFPTIREMIIESNFLTERQIEDLQVMAEIINAMAVADGFLNLDACLKKHPERLDIYNRYAVTALNAVHRVQGIGQRGEITDRKN
jgi:hypothetical protein